MAHNHVNFFRFFVAAMGLCAIFDVSYAVQAPNPRGSSVSQVGDRDNDSLAASRARVSRSVVKSHSVSTSGRGAVFSNAARGGATGARGSQSGLIIRSTTNRNTPTSTARTATALNTSRASSSRATAVYNDISKIGGGYAACRESYATCMDQFCANANDTYRRCYCSARFAEFRDTENALDNARTLLMQFEDNNLNAVDKTAAEVNAMYSATVGEAAIKNDTSAAAKMLDEIGDLLSGKKKSTTTNTLNSIGVLSFDLSGDVDDIWATGGNSIFGNGNTQNLSELDGTDLYKAAHKQCMNVMSNSCENSAVFDMARSSYSILITQDCNAYQKNIDKKVENVKQTVRTAEKYLREARLEEYRSHNSADVNECITKVRNALTADTACGTNYKRCLDYTGIYINQTTGDAIYSPRLFQLTELINLDGGADVLRQNDQFNRFLESRKVFATAALDTCRDISSVVWDEFKRTALIEIAQAQDEKIEEIKMSCVSTMSDCYDTQSNALKNFDKTTAQMSGALSAYAAKQMCVDKVSACAALYSVGEGDTMCKFDSQTGKLTNPTACGLTSLLNFVDAVDGIRIAEGCETALNNYAKELCTPTSGTDGYPWNCRLRNITDIKTNILKMSDTYCGSDVVQYSDNYKTVQSIVDDLVDNIQIDITDAMAEKCEELDGVLTNTKKTSEEYNTVFYRTVYGTATPTINSYGVCVKNTIKTRCDIENERTGNNGYAKYDSLTDTCKFTAEYHQYQCGIADGIWKDNRCYIDK